jgi:hypothetical protein
MSNHEISTLAVRLDRLAEELTPSTDPVVHVRAARARYRRQRRVRATAFALVAAAVLLGVGVPVTIGSLTGSAPGEVAGPSGTTTAAPSAERDRDRATIADEQADQSREQIDLERFARDAMELQGAFSGRPAALLLTAPASRTGCPDVAAALSSRLKAQVQYSGGSLAGNAPGCEWSTDASSPSARLAVGIVFRPGVTEEEMQAEINQDRVNLGCFPAGMPQAPPTPWLSICPSDEQEVWSLSVADAEGAGVWTLSVTMGADYSGVGRPAAMAGLMDVADLTW